ncbi:hypothetical protein [Calidifontibacter indicus]|uniref:hypothetical protein n=1 Tax=Calidifontibacter indicus TaxID=419650 RepID=UPI003D73B1F5
MLIKHQGLHDERELRFTTMMFGEHPLDDWRSSVRYRPTAYGAAPYLALTGPGPSAEAPSSPIASHGYDVPVVRSAIPFRG